MRSVLQKNHTNKQDWRHENSRDKGSRPYEEERMSRKSVVGPKRNGNYEGWVQSTLEWFSNTNHEEMVAKNMYVID